MTSNSAIDSKKTILFPEATSLGVNGRFSGRNPGAEMLPSLTQHQISLVECALRQASKIEQAGWEAIPADLHPSFARYMAREVWTGQSDLLTLREAALLIIRDAITRTGEFTNKE